MSLSPAAIIAAGDRVQNGIGKSGPDGKANTPMTMATINLVVGVDAILLTLGIALGALAYLAEGIYGSRGRLHRWNLLIAAALAWFTWGMLTTIGPDFARAKDATLLSHPADASSLYAVVTWTVVSVIILVADMRYWRATAARVISGRWTR